MTNPVYSFAPDQLGLMPMVISIARAEWRHGECAEWFRCDCVHHRRNQEPTGKPTGEGSGP